MTILEAMKKTFLYKEPKYKPTSEPETKNLEYDIEKDDYEKIPIGFSDNGNIQQGYFANQSQKKWISLIEQKQMIDSYRSAAETVEVQDGIDEVINDAAFTDQQEDIIKLEIDESNKKIKDALYDEFKNVVNNVLNLNDNAYTLMYKFYVDGQLNCKLTYNNGNIKEGIKHIEVISPFYFYFDKDDEKFKYLDVILDRRNVITNITKKEESFSKEEIVRIDSGMYNTENKTVIGWLSSAVKASNQLKTLEDLLIPMRFSRSVSRRVFNVDVGDLPPVKAEKFLKETKNEFKYKKQYNTDTGEIRNNQHITSMVEDYWFANRNGAKGTQVDVLDETGNLGELEDLIYFQKKIFRSMRVPSSRSNRNEDSPTFGPNNEEITAEEMKFYLFVSRFRKRFIPLVKNIFKRNVIAKGIMTGQEYNEYSDKLNFYFSTENKFFLKMKQMEMQNQVDLFSTVKEHIGTVYSYKGVFQDIFNKNEDEMKDLLKEIEKEKSDKMTKDLYATDDGGY